MYVANRWNTGCNTDGDAQLHDTIAQACSSIPILRTHIICKIRNLALYLSFKILHVLLRLDNILNRT